MFFLLRVAFWLSIVLVLLPSGDYRAEEPGAQIGAADAVNAATAAVSDMSGFCGRQPEACEVGGQAAVAFGQRAQAGARLPVRRPPGQDVADPDRLGSAQAGRDLSPSQEHADPRRPAAGMARSAAAEGPAPPGLRTSGTRRFPLASPLPISRVRTATPSAMMTIDEIIDNFELLDEWDDRYRYLIELGRSLPELPEAARTEANKVRGCASQVWMHDRRRAERRGKARSSNSIGDSDAHIVRGLIAILFALYSGKPARAILTTDAQALFEKLGLREHLTPQRSNGFRAMVDRIQSDARAALAA